MTGVVLQLSVFRRRRLVCGMEVEKTPWVGRIEEESWVAEDSGRAMLRGVCQWQMYIHQCATNRRAERVPQSLEFSKAWSAERQALWRAVQTELETTS